MSRIIKITEAVKEIREKIKKEFPTKEGWKFSVRTKNYSTVVCNIMQAPFNLLSDNKIDNGNEQINHYHIDKLYTGEVQIVFNKLNNILSGNQRTIVNDSDYGAVPNYYVNLQIGKWDKKFTVKV